jgi:uncharacterized membrane protein
VGNAIITWALLWPLAVNQKDEAVQRAKWMMQ